MVREELPSATTQATDFITKGLAGSTMVMAGWIAKTVCDNHYSVVKTVDILKDKFADSDKQTAMQLMDLNGQVKDCIKRLDRLEGKVDIMGASIMRLEQALLPKNT